MSYSTALQQQILTQDHDSSKLNKTAVMDGSMKPVGAGYKIGQSQLSQKNNKSGEMAILINEPMVKINEMGNY